MRVSYKECCYDHSEFLSGFAGGYIFLDKEGACTITLTGAAAMSQEELNKWGELIAESLGKAVKGKRRSA